MYYLYMFDQCAHNNVNWQLGKTINVRILLLIKINTLYLVEFKNQVNFYTSMLHLHSLKKAIPFCGRSQVIDALLQAD